MKYGSQVDFAMQNAIEETVVSKVIRGRRQLSLEQQKKWADALGCKTEDVFPEAMHQDTGKMDRARLGQGINNKQQGGENGK